MWTDQFAFGLLLSAHSASSKEPTTVGVEGVYAGGKRRMMMIKSIVRGTTYIISGKYQTLDVETRRCLR